MMDRTKARPAPWWVQAEEKYGSPIPAHVEAAIGRDERRRAKAERFVSQYERGLLSVEELTVRLMVIITEVE